jgi:hypothetical protein
MRLQQSCRFVIISFLDNSFTWLLFDIWIVSAKNRDFKGGRTMQRCETCKLRSSYDKNQRSFLGRLWKWHIGWCPGWKLYLKSLPDEKRRKLREQYR